MRFGSKPLARTTPAVLLAVLPMAVALAGTYRLYRDGVSVFIDFERANEAAFISGFHDRERAGDRHFRWTTGASFIDVEHLPSGGQLEVEARLVVVRPSGQELPLLRFTANGATVYRVKARPGLAPYRFALSSRATSLRLGIHSETFEAGDGRRLGVQVRSIRVSAAKGPAALGGPLLQMTLAAAALLGALTVAGVSLALSSAGATGLTTTFVYFLSRESLRFSHYPERVLLLAAIALALAAALRWILSRVDTPHPADRPALIAVLTGALVLKLAVLFHPLMVGSDWTFHANRLAELLQGNFHLTSVSQHDPPFRIPYPVSLYIVAAPWVLAGFDRIAVLKALTAVLDVGVGFALYFFARRFLGDTRAGLLSIVLYQLVPINVLAFSSGNFTNLFGVSTTVLFFALLLRWAAGGGALSAAGVFGLSVLALTAHFGTFLFDLVLWPLLLAGIYWIAPPGLGGRPSRWLWRVAAGSLLIAFIYYAGYWELVASQWQRVLSRDYATGAAAVTGPLDKLRFNWAVYRGELGVVFIALVFLGAVPILKRAGASLFHATAASWIVATGLFLIADLTTALEVRYVLQAVPILSLLAASYLAGAWKRGKTGRLVVAAAVVYVAAVGLANIHHCLFYRYH